MKCSTSRLSLFVFLCLHLVGCKKEDPNPELSDPIFRDLDSRASTLQKSLDEELKKQGELKLSLQRAEPNTIDLKNAQRDLLKSEHLFLDLDQKARFYKIRAKRRLLVDRITYKIAFSNNEAWPDPHDYSDYQVNMRLAEASRNWGARVPRLHDRVVTPRSQETKEKAIPREE